MKPEPMTDERFEEIRADTQFHQHARRQLIREVDRLRAERSAIRREVLTEVILSPELDPKGRAWVRYLLNQEGGA